MKQISIALATYNGGRYLQEQLESFASQTLKPNELIVSDDCSTDNTLEILKEFAKSAPFQVHIYRNEQNHGYAGNFNQALMKTTGDIVFLSDQDDVWFPQKIQRIVELAYSDPGTLVFMNDAKLTDASLRDTGLTKLGQIRSAGFDESSFVMGCCAAVRRELLDLCLPVPNGFPAHDNWLVKIAEGLGRKRVIPEVWQYYRRHSDNESQWIVNRTTRVSRRAVFLRSWWGYFERSIRGHDAVRSSEISAKTWLEMMRDWANSAITRCPEPYVADLQRYSVELEKRVSAIAYRKIIKGKKLSARFIAVFKYWRSGGYDQFSGIKSAIRDLFS
jgi:glycosyltransferase involved in cell wall biosynthesis